MFMLLQNILNFLLFIPLIGTFVLFFIPYENKILLKQVALFFSSITLNFSLLLCLIFDKSLGSFQNISKLFWLPFLNINIHLGIDGISLFFLILTTLLIYICLLASWTSIFDNVKYFLIFFLLMEFFLIGVFCVLDLLIFYIFFECVLIPMFFIIGLWGSRERKIRAAYFFFFFILFGSVLILLFILYLNHFFHLYSLSRNDCQSCHR